LPAIAASSYVLSVRIDEYFARVATGCRVATEGMRGDGHGCQRAAEGIATDDPARYLPVTIVETLLGSRPRVALSFAQVPSL
jgi:hypothetical protein